MDRLLEWTVKLIFILLLLPFLVSLVLQLAVGALVAILPWFLLASVIAGITAGLSAALVLRRRLPPRNGGALPPSTPPLGPYRTRRPKDRGRGG